MELKDFGEIPTLKTPLSETKFFLDKLFEARHPITIRELIAMWDAHARGSNITRQINGDLESIGYSVVPPLDSGNLDTVLSLQKASEGDGLMSELSDSGSHLLSMTVFPSAVLATQESLLSVPGDAEIPSVITKMLRYDYSQVPVFDEKDPSILLGVFSWRSFAAHRASHENPSVVSEALESAPQVDMHADLFSHISQIASFGYCLVMYRGQLMGLVTTTDLIFQLEELAIPFLAVGQAELELKRVAKSYGLAGENEIDSMMFGQLQNLYQERWERLPWLLSQEDFNEWVNEIRKLRNAVSHHDELDPEIHEKVNQVNRMARWLSRISGGVSSE